MKNKEKEWEGYTMHELKMHRAVNAVRLEIEKEKLSASMNRTFDSGLGHIGGFLAKNFSPLAKGVGLATTAYGVYRKVRSLIR